MSFFIFYFPFTVETIVKHSLHRESLSSSVMYFLLISLVDGHVIVDYTSIISNSILLAGHCDIVDRQIDSDLLFYIIPLPPTIKSRLFCLPAVTEYNS